MKRFIVVQRGIILPVGLIEALVGLARSAAAGNAKALTCLKEVNRILT